MATALPSLAFIDGLGVPEVGLIFTLALVLFVGPKLPKLVQGPGKSARDLNPAKDKVWQQA